MRAFFKTLLAALCVTMIWSAGDVLIGSRQFLEEPRIHVVKEGESFSRLAKHYYGNPDYWRALALINRAPNVDRIYPGEHVMLPDAGTIATIAKSQRMTEVNELVNNQQALAVLESEHDATEFVKDFEATPARQENAPAEESTFAEPESVEMTPEPQESQQPATPSTQPESDAADGLQAFEALSTIEESETQDADATSGLFWPLAGAGVVLFAALVFLFRRNRNRQDDEPEIDASPIKSFILDSESSSEKREDSTMHHTETFSDEIFKPVRRKNEVAKEKEVA